MPATGSAPARGSTLAVQLIANNVADLHGDVQRDRNSVNKSYALNEKGAPVNGVATCRTSTTS